MDKNILVLSAVSGDQESFQRVYEKLKMYAYSIASELFSDSVIREDAVNRAMDEVVDKIRNQRIMFENKPWSYVKRSVSNSLIDLARLREASKLKEENDDSSKRYEKPLDSKELACIDEGFASIVKNGENNSGFRIFKISEVPHDKHPTKKKSESHPWIDTLEEVLTYEWWWEIDQWEDGKAKINPSNESLTFDDIAFRFQYCSEKMWAKWNLTNGLLDNIISHKEKRIMLQHLSGFKQKEIAEKHNVSEPYVSKVLSKYRKDWGWNDDDDMSQAKLMLLSKHLADWYAAPKKYVPPPPNPLYDLNNPKLDELYRKLNKVQDDYEAECTKVNPGWEIRPDDDYDYVWRTTEEPEDDNIQADWIAKVRKYGLRQALAMFGGKNPVHTYYESIESERPQIKTSPEIEAFEAEIDKLRDEIYYVIHPGKENGWKTRESAIEEIVKFEQEKNDFYKIVTTSPKMKAYFHDLDLSGIVQLNRLFHIAEAFFRSWYPNVRLNATPDYGTWTDYPSLIDLLS